MVPNRFEQIYQSDTVPIVAAASRSMRSSEWGCIAESMLVVDGKDIKVFYELSTVHSPNSLLGASCAINTT